MTDFTERVERLVDELWHAEMLMYREEEEKETDDWDRIEQPLEQLARLGKNEDPDHIRDVFRDVMHSCKSGVTFAFAGRYSILIDPDHFQPVLRHVEERLQMDLDVLQREVDEIKQGTAEFPELSMDCFWFTLHNFYPYVFQFLRHTDRTMDPDHVDHLLNDFTPAYFNTFDELRSFIEENEATTDQTLFHQIRSNITSFITLIQTFYMALSGRSAEEVYEAYFGDEPEFEQDGIPTVPLDELNWVQEQWSDRRPENGSWKPDPIEGKNPMVHMEEMWTWELT